MAVMFGAVFFGLILPMTLHQGHNVPLAVGLSVLFGAYLAVQLVLWRRMKPRS
jgi:hypothetical protein